LAICHDADDPFGECLAQTHHTDLVGHLRDLAGTRITHQRDASRVRRDHGFDVIEGSLVSTRHHGERSLARSVDATRYRCVEERSAGSGNTHRHSACGLCRGGRVIDPHAPRGHGRLDVIGNREQLTIGWQRRDHDVGITHRIGRRLRRATSHFGHEAISHPGDGIAHRDVMTLAHEMRGHVPSHPTDSDHGNRAAHAGTPG